MGMKRPIPRALGHLHQGEIERVASTPGADILLAPERQGQVFLRQLVLTARRALLHPRELFLMNQAKHVRALLLLLDQLEVVAVEIAQEGHP
ncbi:hypothetical protein D3C86_1704490 [compost metagenome]